jgi:DNA processing protein
MDEIDTSQDLVSWLILVHTPGLSPVLVNKLLTQLDSASNIIGADRSELIEAKLKNKSIDYFRKPDWERIDADLEWLKVPGNHFICCKDVRYPTLLRNIPDPPIALYMSGNADVLSTTQIAIIGTRKSTSGGRRIAAEFAAKLGNLGLTVTGGLAIGIDTAAHNGAISSNNPTIAVLGNGLDIKYPKINTELTEKICEYGVIVSEFPIRTMPIPSNFPRRNRIISGLSVGTLVVEAALKSGSLITARLAMEQGREVFAIPGSIYSPVSKGCHALIKDGAKITTNIEDIVEEIGPLASVALQSEPRVKNIIDLHERLDEQSKLLLDNIGYEAMTIDQLVLETGMVSHTVTVLIVDLELKGMVESLSGGRVARKI